MHSCTWFFVFSVSFYLLIILFVYFVKLFEKLQKLNPFSKQSAEKATKTIMTFKEEPLSLISILQIKIIVERLKKFFFQSQQICIGQLEMKKSIS